MVRVGARSVIEIADNEAMRAICFDNIVDAERLMRAESAEEARACRMKGYHTMWVTHHHILNIRELSEGFLKIGGSVETAAHTLAMGEHGDWDQRATRCAMAVLYEARLRRRKSMSPMSPTVPHHVKFESVQARARRIDPRALHERIRRLFPKLNGTPIRAVHHLEPATLALESKSGDWAVICLPGVDESEALVRRLEDWYAQCKTDEPLRWTTPSPNPLSKEEAYERVVGTGVFGQMEDFRLDHLDGFSDAEADAICRSGAPYASTPKEGVSPLLRHIKKHIYYDMDRRILDPLSLQENLKRLSTMKTFDGYQVDDWILLDETTLATTSRDGVAHVYVFEEPVQVAELREKGLDNFSYDTHAEPVDEVLSHGFWWQDERAKPSFGRAEDAAIGRALSKFGDVKAYEKKLLDILGPTYKLDTMDLGGGRLDDLEAIDARLEHVEMTKEKDGGELLCHFRLTPVLLIENAKATQVEVIESYSDSLHLVRDTETGLYAGVVGGYQDDEGDIDEPTYVGTWMRGDVCEELTFYNTEYLRSRELVDLRTRGAHRFLASMGTQKMPTLAQAFAYHAAQESYTLDGSGTEITIDGAPVECYYIGGVSLKWSDERVWVDRVRPKNREVVCPVETTFAREGARGTWKDALQGWQAPAMFEGLAILCGKDDFRRLNNFKEKKRLRDDLAHHILNTMVLSEESMTLALADGYTRTIGHAADVSVVGRYAIIKTLERHYVVDLGRGVRLTKDEIGRRLATGKKIAGTLAFEPFAPGYDNPSMSDNIGQAALEVIEDASIDEVRALMYAEAWTDRTRYLERKLVRHALDEGRSDAVAHARRARTYLDLVDELGTYGGHTPHAPDHAAFSARYGEPTWARYGEPTWERVGRLAMCTGFTGRKVLATKLDEWPESMRELEDRVIEMDRERVLDNMDQLDELDWREGVAALNVHAEWIDPVALDEIGVERFVEDERAGRQFATGAQRVAFHSLINSKEQRVNVWAHIDTPPNPHDIALMGYRPDFEVGMVEWKASNLDARVPIDIGAGPDLELLSQICELYQLDTDAIAEVGRWMFFYQLGDPNMNQTDVREELTHYAKSAPEDFEFPADVPIEDIFSGGRVNVKQSAEAILELHDTHDMAVDVAQAVVAKYVLEHMSDDNEAVSPDNEGVVKAINKQDYPEMGEVTKMGEENKRKAYSAENKPSFQDRAKEVAQQGMLAGSIDDISSAALDAMREMLGHDYVDAVLGNENGKDMTRVLIGYAAMFMAMNHSQMVPHPKLVEKMSAAMAGRSTGNLMARNQKKFREMFMTMITAAEDSFGSVEEAKQAFGVLEPADEDDVVFEEQPEVANAQG